MNSDKRLGQDSAHLGQYSTPAPIQRNQFRLKPYMGLLSYPAVVRQLNSITLWECSATDIRTQDFAPESIASLISSVVTRPVTIAVQLPCWKEFHMGKEATRPIDSGNQRFAGQDDPVGRTVRTVFDPNAAERAITAIRMATSPAPTNRKKTGTNCDTGCVWRSRSFTSWTMPIFRLPSNSDPLTQGDVLRGIPLYRTHPTEGTTDYQAQKVQSNLCLVLSRPCVATRKSEVIVAAIRNNKDRAGQETSMPLLRFMRFSVNFATGLAHLGQRFYLGQIPAEI